MSVRGVHVPVVGPPVARMPALEHEFEAAGLRVMALPPGPIELRQVVRSHFVDVNLHTVRNEHAVNSDRFETKTYHADTVAWAPPGTDFRLLGESYDWGLLLEVDPSKIEAVLQEDTDSAAIPIDYVDYAAASLTATLGRHLLSHIRQGAHDPLFIEGLSLAILSGALEVANPKCGAFDRAIRGDPDLRIARAIDHFEAHHGEPLSIAELAAVACLSPSHFSRVFKATRGEAVWTYVQRRRCERAREMLLHTRLPLAEIAHRCGFAHRTHMTRAVKAAYGATPGAIRSSL